MLSGALAPANRLLTAAIAAALAARLPLVMMGLSLVLLVRDQGHPYWVVGLVSGAFVLSTAFASPVLGRVADRVGAVRVLLGSVCVAVAALLTMAAVPGPLGAPGLMAVAALAGAAEPPVTAVLRAMMPRVADGERLRTAYALEAALQEATFVGGPPIVVLVVALASPRAAVALCAVLLLAATLWFTSVVRPHVTAGAPHEGAHVLSSVELRLLLVAFAAMGVMFGCIDIATVASLDAHGHRDLAGLALGVWAIGSLVAGVVVARRARRPPWQRLPRLLVLIGMLTAPLVVLQREPWLLAAGLFVQGAVIAPTLGTVFELVPRLAPQEALTEAFAWTSSFILAGFAGGAAVAGVLVGWGGAERGFVLATAAPLAASLAAGALRRRVAAAEVAG